MAHYDIDLTQEVDAEKLAILKQLIDEQLDHGFKLRRTHSKQDSATRTAYSITNATDVENPHTVGLSNSIVRLEDEAPLGSGNYESHYYIVESVDGSILGSGTFGKVRKILGEVVFTDDGSIELDLVEPGIERVIKVMYLSEEIWQEDQQLIANELLINKDFRPNTSEMSWRVVTEGGVKYHKGYFTQQQIHGVDLVDLVEPDHRAGYIIVRQLKFYQRLELCYLLAKEIKDFHDAGYISRDIKLHNLMLDFEMLDGIISKVAVKITDFGFGRKAGEAHQDGRIVGTPHFLSYEILKGKKSYQASDMYALAGVIAELFLNPATTISGKRWQELTVYHTRQLGKEYEDGDQYGFDGLFDDPVAKVFAEYKRNFPDEFENNHQHLEKIKKLLKLLSNHDHSKRPNASAMLGLFKTLILPQVDKNLERLGIYLDTALTHLGDSNPAASTALQAIQNDLITTLHNTNIGQDDFLVENYSQLYSRTLSTLHRYNVYSGYLDALKLITSPIGCALHHMAKVVRFDTIDKIFGRALKTSSANIDVDIDIGTAGPGGPAS